MGYASLAHCVKDLEAHGDLRRITCPIDPKLELACVQRLAFKAQAPALLFSNVTGCKFPILANLFGTKERLHFLFREELASLEELLALGARVKSFNARPFEAFKTLAKHAFSLLHAGTRSIPASQARVLSAHCPLEDLPHIVSWPKDGGPFITLPLVYSEDPSTRQANLGMYRVQLAGNDYLENEVGLHYQIHRGIGVHHAHALAKGQQLPVHIYVGGPPALSLAAVMPLPEGFSELKFAGLLAGRGLGVSHLQDLDMPILADADFCLVGKVLPQTKPEGPFGDHLGYYSLAHPYPVVQVTKVFHRAHAIWPYTSVGRPPQEDTILGEFIHELTAPLIGSVFPGVSEVHAVDAAGVHPLLLALGEERYVPYAAKRKPREIITQALHLLGTSQTALAKYLLIMAREDVLGLSTRDVRGFFKQLLRRTHLERDLHILTQVPNDSLDYTGGALHEGSKLIWAAAGEAWRTLGSDLASLTLPQRFTSARLIDQGIVTLKGPKHTQAAGVVDADLTDLAAHLGAWEARECFPLVIVADDPDFVAKDFANFLWVTFTRSDPATDLYGPAIATSAKHWGCTEPLIIDARKKLFHAPVLEDDPQVLARVLELGASGGPLDGCI
ncbi:MAG: UbiD family decarboxylase [Desulfovibrionaceae bacterium]|nr:UbiD family decarboxylase [Desulfovibrionaceae bacterium]